MSRKSRVALAAILVALPGGCQSAEEAGERVHSYVSTDQELALIVGKGRYRFGPRLLADHDKVLEGEEKFVATDQGCYHLDFIVLAKPTQRETSCGSFIVRLMEDSTLQQNAKRAGHSPPFQTYEATCRPSAKFCPGQKWNGPTVRYYATTEGELLAFELYPTDSNRTVFVRTSPTALKL